MEFVERKGWYYEVWGVDIEDVVALLVVAEEGQLFRADPLSHEWLPTCNFIWVVNKGAVSAVKLNPLSYKGHLPIHSKRHGKLLRETKLVHEWKFYYVCRIRQASKLAGD